MPYEIEVRLQVPFHYNPETQSYQGESSEFGELEIHDFQVIVPQNLAWATLIGYNWVADKEEEDLLEELEPPL